ncbi:MAG: hypothetical protein QOE28_760 [Solirubrobacteraceae bacterium]|jgi:uncharacterized protein (DUF488 family)|nr:hypothetical protein [Solirubrobacteraceae bacterium]
MEPVPATTLYTIGYERLLPPELVAELMHAGVERLLDVRYRPQSRRPGMSKTRLGQLLADHGIAYEHRKALGTPPDIRWLFHHNRTAEARAAYAEHVEATAAAELDALAAELASGSAPATALLCLEADPAACHRRVVAEALVARRPEIAVQDL